jgi:uncharacterized Zn-finger protein
VKREHGDSPREPMIECKECGKLYKSKVGLNYHMEKNHGTGGPPKVHACTQCAETFASAGALVRHRRHKHDSTPYKRFPCTKCERTFSTKNALR